MKLVALALGLVAFGSHSAEACGVPDFGRMLADVAKAFDSKTEEISTPLVVVGGGYSTEGDAGSVAIGWGWGERESGAFFPGTTLSRALVNLRRDHDATAVSLTYGWYENVIGSVGFDFGAEHNALGTGPIARFTLGFEGIAARVGGGFMFGGDEPAFAGQAEIVVDILDLTDQI